MPKTRKKEKWRKPKLIVLTRGKPEERVLEACKTYNNWGGYGSDNAFCGYYEVSSWCDAACAGTGSS